MRTLLREDGRAGSSIVFWLTADRGNWFLSPFFAPKISHPCAA